MLTDPIRFTLGEHHVTSATSSYSSAVGTISGIVASILAILLAAAAIVFYRRQRSSHGKSVNGNVAFENPTYTRGLEQVQVCIVIEWVVLMLFFRQFLFSKRLRGLIRLCEFSSIYIFL